jgi:hypothetical protein
MTPAARTSRRSSGLRLRRSECVSRGFACLPGLDQKLTKLPRRSCLTRRSRAMPASTPSCLVCTRDQLLGSAAVVRPADARLAHRIWFSRPEPPGRFPRRAVPGSFSPSCDVVSVQGHVFHSRRPGPTRHLLSRHRANLQRNGHWQDIRGSAAVRSQLSPGSAPSWRHPFVWSPTSIVVVAGAHPDATLRQGGPFAVAMEVSAEVRGGALLSAREPDIERWPEARRTR